MARIALLAILAIWMSWSKGLGSAEPAALRAPVAVAVFLGVYAILVLGLRAWASVACRRAGAALRRFHLAMHFARLLVPAWLGVGIYVLNWGRIVQSIVPALYRWPSDGMHLEFPQVLLGTLPAMLAWMALWWSQFPVDRAVREHGVLDDLDDDLPIHAPPPFREVFAANFRLQIAFTLAPVVVILILRDITVLALGLGGVRGGGGLQDTIMLPATLLVFVLAPEMLRRVLHTEKLPDSPLRRRLEAMCRQANLRYREILLWRTGCTMGNAAVMGLFPRVRYVLLSDLLLETMTDQQIEAVFAHELGHVVHMHLWWFSMFIGIAILAIGGPGGQLLAHFEHWYVIVRHHSPGQWDTIEGLVATLLFFGSFVMAFGFLSPRFERQADVYAARTLQGAQELIPVIPQAALVNDRPPTLEYQPGGSYVGEYGAGVFAEALRRVAVINHIPVHARNWSHGSISDRMRALHEMSASPAHTGRFDRAMRRLYIGLVASLCVFIAWNLLPQLRTSTAPRPAIKMPVPPQAVGVGRT